MAPPAVVPPGAPQRAKEKTGRASAARPSPVPVAGLENLDLLELSGSLWELGGTALSIFVDPSMKLTDDEIVQLAGPTEKVLKKLPKLQIFEKYKDEIALIVAVLIVFGPKFSRLEKRKEVIDNGLARETNGEEYRGEPLPNGGFDPYKRG